MIPINSFRLAIEQPSDDDTFLLYSTDRGQVWPSDVTVCVVPNPPAGWTCHEEHFTSWICPTLNTSCWQKCRLEKMGPGTLCAHWSKHNHGTIGGSEIHCRNLCLLCMGLLLVDAKVIERCSSACSERGQLLTGDCHPRQGNL